MEKSSSIYWAFVISHTFAWSVICGGCVLYDLPELLGLSQVYNDISNCLPPLTYKSIDLRRLIGRVRHPSFLALTVILWVVNLMRYIMQFQFCHSYIETERIFVQYFSLDRLILATLWTVYMYVAWNTDDQDVIYHRSQLFKKKIELKSQFRNLHY